METLIKHQTAFINAIGGSDSTHTDSQLAQVHAQLGVSDADFDQLVGLLAETLSWHGMGGAAAELIVEHFEKRRELIVTSG